MAVLESYNLTIRKFQLSLNQLYMTEDKITDYFNFDSLSSSPCEKEPFEYSWYEMYQNEQYYTLWKSLKEFLTQLLNEYMDNITDSLENIRDSLFETTIDFFLTKTPKAPDFFYSFEIVFRIFALFGLIMIPIDSINLIIFNLQKQKINPDLKNLNFIIDYYQSLPITSGKEYKEKIEDLLAAMRSRIKQENQRKKILNDLQRIIDEEFEE